MTGRLPQPRDGEPQEPAPAEVSERSRGVALTLAILGGVVGLHRFYAGRTESGIIQILTFGGLGLWWLYDVILVAAGEFRDAENRPIRAWAVGEVAGLGGASAGEVRYLTGEVERLRHEVTELAERVDFAERMLARQRERKQLGPGVEP